MVLRALQLMENNVTNKFSQILLNCILSALMVSIVSSVVIIINQGLGPDFLSRWARSFVTTWPVAFPALMILGPIVRKIVERVSST